MTGKALSIERVKPEMLSFWPIWLRVLFRFSFLYWALSVLPGGEATSLFNLAPWSGHRVENMLGWLLRTLTPLGPAPDTTQLTPVQPIGSPAFFGLTVLDYKNVNQIGRAHV